MKFRKFNIRVPWGKLGLTNWGEKCTSPTAAKVLLVPGIESWPESWNQVAAEFQKENVSIVAFDYPGHGSSTYPEYYFPMTNLHGFSIRCLLNELAWDDVHLVGFSHGAYTAAIYSMLYPDEVSSLTNIDGYFNMRLRPQKSVLRKYIKEEMETFLHLSKDTLGFESKGKSKDSLKRKFIAGNHLGQYMANETADKIADEFVQAKFKINSAGLYESNLHQVTKASLFKSAVWSYTDSHFEELVKLIDFPVLHIKSNIHDSPSGIYPPGITFPIDLAYNHGTAEMVETATNENGFKFTEKYVDGPHMLQLTHAKDLAQAMKEHFASTH